MDFVRSYILSVIAAALICGIISALTEQSYAKDAIQLMCGFFMMITLFSPIIHTDWDTTFDFSLPAYEDALDTANWGEKKAQEAVSNIIIKETEAYILDKATLLNTNIDVTVTLDACQLPEKAILSGTISPLSRIELEQILESDLGITKENQLWTG